MKLEQLEKICNEFAEFILQYPGLYVSHGDQGTKNRYRLNYPVGRDVTIEELMEQFQHSITIDGIECPDCGYRVYTPHGNIAMSEPIMNSEGFHDWIELHECKKCEKLIIIKNGT